MRVRREILNSLEALSSAAARHLVRLANQAVEQRGKFSLVLAGGSTPRRLYEILAQEHRDEIPWDRIDIFWGDERLVPPESSESNFKMAHDALLSKVQIPPGNIHSMALYSHAPAKAADIYEGELRRFFGEAVPSFDLVLLGMGEDGHTASLFPGDPVLNERESWVAGVIAPDSRPPLERITLTLPLINRARVVFFLVSGESKQEALRAIMNNGANATAYPAAQVRAQHELCWYVDKAAYPQS